MCGYQELAIRGHYKNGYIFNCEKDNNYGNFWSLLRFRTLSGNLTLKTHWMNLSGKSVYIRPMF